MCRNLIGLIHIEYRFEIGDVAGQLANVFDLNVPELLFGHMARHGNDASDGCFSCRQRDNSLYCTFSISGEKKKAAQIIARLSKYY
jgi:hypothetical protein